MKGRKRDGGRKIDGMKGEGWRKPSGTKEGVMGARRCLCVVVVGPHRHSCW